MQRSSERILTSHVGSLPRSQEVVDFLFTQDRGEAYDQAKFDAAMARGVEDVVAKQVANGIDIVSDGETSKISYATYIRHRLTGFEGDSSRPTPQDLDDFPAFRDRLVAEGHSAKYLRPVCKGEITVKDDAPLLKDIARMKAALGKVKATEGFMTAVSPGTIAVFQPNEYYKSHEAYMEALANAMRDEYEKIVNAGILQRDLSDAARAPVLGRRAARRELRHEAREFHQVLARVARRIAAEARKAVGNVGRVADLAGLAVADDVDAGLDLAADDVGDGAGDHRRRRARVADLAPLAPEQHVGHRLGARQAADVGREDAPAAGPHR